TDILARRTEPISQAGPLPNQRLVTHFKGGCSSQCTTGQEACRGEGAGDLPDDSCLFGIGQQQFGERSAASCGVLLRCSWLDQTQEQGSCQSAMLLRRQCSVRGLGML